MARRMSVTLKEYRFFRSFSTKIENWPMRKAEALWRKMRERKIAGNNNKIPNSLIEQLPHARALFFFVVYFVKQITMFGDRGKSAKIN